MAKVHTFFKYKFRYTVCVKKKTLISESEKAQVLIKSINIIYFFI